MKKAKSSEDEGRVIVGDDKETVETAKGKNKASVEEDDVTQLATVMPMSDILISPHVSAKSTLNLQTRIHDLFKFEIDSSLYKVQDEILDVGKPGLRLAAKCLVLSTHPANNLKFADIILAVDDEEVRTREQFTMIYRRAVRRHKKKLKLKILRLIYHLPFVPSRLPLGYEPPLGYTYLVVVLYRMPYLKMSLSIKSYMAKVFVAEAPMGTASGLSLQQGDAIVDVDKTPVSSVDHTRKAIMDKVDEKGMVTLLIERPNDDAAFQFCRMVLNFKKKPPIDCGLARDVRDICRKEQKNIKHGPRFVPKSILKVDSGEPPSRKVAVSKNAVETSIFAQANPRLLGPVPHNQTELILSRLNNWKSETSSDSLPIRSPSTGSTEETHRKNKTPKKRSTEK